MVERRRILLYGVFINKRYKKKKEISTWSLTPTFGGFFCALLYLYYKVEYTIITLILVVFIAIYRLMNPKKTAKIRTKSKKPTIWYKNGKEV